MRLTYGYSIIIEHPVPSYSVSLLETQGNLRPTSLFSLLTVGDCRELVRQAAGRHIRGGGRTTLR